MGNAYTFVEYIEHGKRKLIDITDLPRIMVHGSAGYEALITLYKSGLTLDKIAPKFCSYCGGYMGDNGCGCSNPSPQRS